MPVLSQCSGLSELRADLFVDLLAAPVVWGDDDGVLRLRGIIPGDSSNAVMSVGNLRDTALFRQQFDTFHGFIVGEMLHCL